jgi:hypothetical protein
LNTLNRETRHVKEKTRLARVGNYLQYALIRHYSNDIVEHGHIGESGVLVRVSIVGEHYAKGLNFISFSFLNIFKLAIYSI